MRDNFSQYACRLSKKISSDALLKLEKLNMKFPDQFSSQIVKMILSRILLESLESTENFDLPYKKEKILHEYEHHVGHFKMKFKISGIEEPLIARFSNDDAYGFFLFGYDYTSEYYMYFAKESDDQLNKNFMNGSNIDLSGISHQKRAFIYKFNGKNIPANVWGKQYLCDTILSHIVPTIKEYELSPIEFVPYWCFLFNFIIAGATDKPSFKEVVKHYPNFISNRLIHHYYAKLYKPRYTFSDRIVDYFESYSPKTDIQKKLMKSIINNKNIPSLNPRNKRETSLMQETIQYLKKQCPVHLFFITGRWVITSSPEQEFSLNAQTMATFYKLLKNPDELTDAYLAYKFKRPFQIA
ncbi:hypothetical protein NAEGRDRAFT_79357 [Naegleria gruberi]|uniref:Uncharacterized protein n=1 Tax=Naegleria gruberi TaxID=5762 RepID=D2VBV9_NAEGR|nr:uncharacterized protein NAEGRDRAFT_79357 [Naegleria gruberi]EFC45542.1 hypothetical protein NAEGRDRAFT_79357 [Naegleria gruberi]|eukprot:XP_002678286.1 hypothetical protein NAEGRDRAFT_79357 [Naegleria gruberi strain NEG-M]